VAGGARPGPDGPLLAGVALLLLPGVAGACVADQPHPPTSPILYTPVCTEVTGQLGQPPGPSRRSAPTAGRRGGRRPWRRPAPAAVRSRMRSRSNSARAARRGGLARRRGWWRRSPPAGCGTRPTVGQSGDGVDQMPQGAAEAIQFSRRPGCRRGAVGPGPARGRGGRCGRRWRSRLTHPRAAGTFQGVDQALGLLVSGGGAA
jgi:hypothetical protein